MPTKNYSERFYSGTGSPEGVVEAPVGAFYCRTDGAADTTFYKKTSGSAETGWTAITFTGSSGDYTAAQVTNTPAGNIAATDVQTALNELDTEKALLVHTHDAADVATGTLAEARVPQTVTTANGGVWTRGSASELITLSTSGATTDSSANLLPANSIIEAVVARVTTTITTATDWALGDGTTDGRFAAANATLTAGTTTVGLAHQKGAVSTDATGPVQVAAAKLRIKTTGTPGAGAIRCTVFYRTFTAPTS